MTSAPAAHAADEQALLGALGHLAELALERVRLADREEEGRHVSLRLSARRTASRSRQTK